MQTDPAALLRDHGLRVTRQRVAVLRVLAARPHSAAETVIAGARADSGPMSGQAVYDVLNTLADRGIVRRIQPAGSVARYELRVGDNHHHVVCRSCGLVADIDCAVGEAPCLVPGDLGSTAPGFLLDEAEVTYWGLCSACSGAAPDIEPAPLLSPQHRRNA